MKAGLWLKDPGEQVSQLDGVSYSVHLRFVPRIWKALPLLSFSELDFSLHLLADFFLHSLV